MLEDRREICVARAVIAVSTIAFLVLMATLPPVFETPDEAKYVGLGLNVLAGRGLVTALGEPFLDHSPLWALILAGPRMALGLDPIAVGHVLDAVAGGGVIIAASALAWRVRPAAGAVAAMALLASPYLMSLARTAGIDLPAAALGLSYLWLAARAMERGSTRLGVLAGVALGLAVLVKETALPVAPVPMLAAWLTGVGILRIARATAATIIAAALVVGWWFWLYAAATGLAYRLETPAWTLAPVIGGLAIVVASGAFAGRIERLPRVGAWATAMPARSILLVRRSIAVGGIAAWVLGELLVYADATKLAGAPLVRASQLSADAATYLPDIGLPLGFGLGGAILLLRRPLPARAADLAFAVIAMLPLVALVLAIGETPRHSVLGLAALVALGACGWVIGATVPRSRRGWLRLAAALTTAGILAVPDVVTPRTVALLVGLPRAAWFAVLLGATVLVAALVVMARRVPRSSLRTTPVGWPLVARLDSTLGHGGLVLAAALLVFGGVATVRAATVRASGDDQARAHAVRDVGAWIAQVAPPGATVVVGPVLAYELALALRDDVHVIRLGPGPTVVDGRPPFGLVSGADQLSDPLTLDSTLRNVDQVDALSAGVLLSGLEGNRPSIWVEAAVVASGIATTPTLALLDATAGFDRLRTWTYGAQDGDVIVVAYSVNVDQVVLPTDATYATPGAIRTLARLLAAHPGSGPLAQALLGRLIPVPPSADATAAVDALRHVSQGLAP